MEVRDDVGREVLYVDPAVNFAHRDGVGFFDFQYPWNIEVYENCYYVEIRSQDGSYRQGPRGYTMQGRENRSVCTCMPEPINARVPAIDPVLCRAELGRRVARGAFGRGAILIRPILTSKSPMSRSPF